MKAWVGAVLAFSLGAAAGAQGRWWPLGVASPGRPVMRWSPEGEAFRWPGLAVAAHGGSSWGLLWPAAPLRTAAAPPPQVVAEGVALVGALGRAPAPARVAALLGRDVVLRALPAELPVPAWPSLLGLDALWVASPRELEAVPGAAAWLRLGGVVLSPQGGAPAEKGFGLWVEAGKSLPASVRGRAFAELRPPAPPPPPRPRSRLLVGVVLLALLYGAALVRLPQAWAAVVAVLSGGGILLLPPDLWTERSRAALWCLPGAGGRAWVRETAGLFPRGARPGQVTFRGEGVLLARWPPGAEVNVRPGEAVVRWRGSGVVEALLVRPGLQRVVRRPRGWLLEGRAGFRITESFWIEPRGVWRLPPLAAGRPVGPGRRWSEPLPAGLAEVVRRLPPPPREGFLVGRLEGPGLSGTHWVCALACGP